MTHQGTGCRRTAAATTADIAAARVDITWCTCACKPARPAPSHQQRHQADADAGWERLAQMGIRHSHHRSRRRRERCVVVDGTPHVQLPVHGWCSAADEPKRVHVGCILRCRAAGREVRGELLSAELLVPPKSETGHRVAPGRRNSAMRLTQRSSRQVPSHYARCATHTTVPCAPAAWTPQGPGAGQLPPPGVMAPRQRQRTHAARHQRSCHTTACS